MSDRMSAEIWIGGKLKRELLPDFCATVTAEHVGFEFDTGVVAIETADDLEQAIEPLNGARVLHFCQSLARWGEFVDLETRLQQHGLPYRRQTSASDCYDGRLVEFRPGSKPVAVTTNTNGRPIASIEAVERAWYLLKGAEQLLDLGRNVRPVLLQAIELLGGVLPPELPPLPDFKIVD